MFFLLATFMLASLAMQRLGALRITLPTGRAGQMAASDPLTVSVDSRNQVFVNRQPVSAGQVEAMVKRLLQPDGMVVIAADDAAGHGVVVQTMLAARRAGAQRFLFAVHRE